jgi:hypothetical protein
MSALRGALGELQNNEVKQVCANYTEGEAEVMITCTSRCHSNAA